VRQRRLKGNIRFKEAFMRGVVLASTGSYLPQRTVHNEALDQFPDEGRLLISQKTGVFSRRRAEESQCTSDLALIAARNCLQKADIPASEVRAVVVSTSSPDRMQPATATRVQHLLGAENAFAFDINSVCSGSTFGIALCSSLIQSSTCDNVLFVAAELYSKILNRQDFSTFPYFGDGAGAFFFRADSYKQGVLHSLLRTDGSGRDVICVPGGGTMLPFEKMTSTRQAHFKMKGKAVFEFAVDKGTDIIRQLLQQTGERPEGIKCFICHQANVHIILKIAENLGVDEEKFYMNLFRYGNTASASVPIALDEAIGRNIVGKGDLVVTAAFGGGLSWGANLIRL
jgi:3-oxoacyl-[acyl-carrier-protein] synthase-3